MKKETTVKQCKNCGRPEYEFRACPVCGGKLIEVKIKPTSENRF